MSAKNLSFTLNPSCCTPVPHFPDWSQFTGLQTDLNMMRQQSKSTLSTTSNLQFCRHPAEVIVGACWWCAQVAEWSPGLLVEFYHLHSLPVFWLSSLGTRASADERWLLLEVLHAQNIVTFQIIIIITFCVAVIMFSPVQPETGTKGTVTGS